MRNQPPPADGYTKYDDNLRKGWAPYAAGAAAIALIIVLVWLLIEVF